MLPEELLNCDNYKCSASNLHKEEVGSDEQSCLDDSLTNLDWLYTLRTNELCNVDISNRQSDSEDGNDFFFSDANPVKEELNLGAFEMYDQDQVLSFSDYARVPVKPPYSYSQLIFMAMASSGKDKLLLNEIYSYITEHFAYYKKTDISWQNSIRHNLSLSRYFLRLPREPNKNGKGGYWTVKPGCSEEMRNGLFKKRPGTYMFTTDPYNSSLRRRSYMPNRSRCLEDTLTWKTLTSQLDIDCDKVKVEKIVDSYGNVSEKSLTAIQAPLLSPGSAASYKGPISPDCKEYYSQLISSADSCIGAETVISQVPKFEEGCNIQGVGLLHPLWLKSEESDIGCSDNSYIDVTTKLRL